MGLQLRGAKGPTEPQTPESQSNEKVILRVDPKPLGSFEAIFRI